MAASLTQHDVLRLLAEPSPGSRVELADKLAADLTGGALAAGEVTLAQDIVRILAGDVEARVRAALSHGLRHARTLPHDVALRLAEDIDAVALPMLAESLVLTDEDLVALVRAGSSRKQETIASRPHLTETIADALITHAAEPAVAVLMGNHTARIAEDSLGRAVTRFAASDPVKEAMARRKTLPMTVSERLVALVSRELQDARYPARRQKDDQQHERRFRRPSRRSIRRAVPGTAGGLDPGGNRCRKRHQNKGVWPT